MPNATSNDIGRNDATVGVVGKSKARQQRVAASRKGGESSSNSNTGGRAWAAARERSHGRGALQCACAEQAPSDATGEHGRRLIGDRSVASSVDVRGSPRGCRWRARGGRKPEVVVVARGDGAGRWWRRWWWPECGAGGLPEGLARIRPEEELREVAAGVAGDGGEPAVLRAAGDGDGGLGRKRGRPVGMGGARVSEGRLAHWRGCLGLARFLTRGEASEAAWVERSLVGCGFGGRGAGGFGR
ncbi:hypothetical protein ZWY2020_010739 [Hordeum vulgare]|nr:hypothetical protein ZWY2020_010739 [Hordeum vulgare]